MQISKYVVNIFIDKAKQFNNSMKKSVKQIKEIEGVEINKDTGILEPKKGSKVQLAKNSIYTEFLPTNENRAMANYTAIRDKISIENATWVAPYVMRANGLSQNDVDKVIAEGLVRMNKDKQIAKEDFELLNEHLSWMTTLIEDGLLRIPDNVKKETWLLVDMNKKGNSKIKNKLLILDSIFDKYQEFKKLT